MFCIGIGVGSQNTAGAWLEVAFPKSLLGPSATLIKEIETLVPL